jgi:hypothetical protein
VRLNGIAYGSIGEAYNAIVSDSGRLELREIEFTCDMIFDREITATLSGGNNPSFTSRPGMTVIRGAVTISAGLVVMDQITIM